MGLMDYIIIAVVVIVLGAAAFYIYKAKKSGKKCIGCPENCSCCAKNRCCGYNKEK